MYSLGATLYCLLTGKPPVEGDDLGAVLGAVQKGEFPQPRKLDPSIDKALEAVCLKAMALQPEDRYETPRALADDIELWLADEPVAAYPERPIERLGRWLRQHRTWTYGGRRRPLRHRAGRHRGRHGHRGGQAPGSKWPARRPRPISSWHKMP